MEVVGSGSGEERPWKGNEERKKRWVGVKRSFGPVEIEVLCSFRRLRLVKGGRGDGVDPGPRQGDL